MWQPHPGDGGAEEGHCLRWILSPRQHCQVGTACLADGTVGSSLLYWFSVLKRETERERERERDLGGFG